MTSPYVTLYGVAPKTPLRALQRETVDGFADQTEPAFVRIREFVKEALTRAQNQQKEYYDRFRQKQDFKLLDSVWVKSHYTPRDLSKKLQPKWEGPYFVYKVIEIDGQAMSVILVDESTGKFRRASFQDLKHFEQREALNEETIDELIEQKLPGIIIQQSTLQARQESSLAHQNNTDASTSFASTTTEPSSIRELSSSTTVNDTPQLLLQHTSSSNSNNNTTSVVIERSSVWDEIIPKDWRRAKIVGNQNEGTDIIEGGQTVNNNVVTFSNGLLEQNTYHSHTNKSDQIAQIDAMTNDRHHTVESIDDDRHHAGHQPIDLNHTYLHGQTVAVPQNNHTNLHGQTVAIQQNNHTISLASNCSQTAINSDTTAHANDPKQPPTQAPLECTTNPVGDTGQTIMQSTPLIPTDNTPNNAEHGAINVSNIRARNVANIVSIDDETTHDSDSHPSSDRPKRNPRIPDRYQA